MEAVCIMLSIKPERRPEPGTGRMFDDFWGPSVKLLGDMKFLDKLKTYEKDNIPPPTIKRIREKSVTTLCLLCGRPNRPHYGSCLSVRLSHTGS